MYLHTSYVFTFNLILIMILAPMFPCGDPLRQGLPAWSVIVVAVLALLGSNIAAL